MRSNPALCLILFTCCCATPAAVQIAQAQDAKPPILIDSSQTTLIQNVEIAAPIPGVVAAVDVKEGDIVAIGKRLVLLSDAQVKTELAAAKAAHETARLAADNDVDRRYAVRTLEVRQREFEQSQIANQKFSGAVSQTELDRLRLVVDQSRLAIEQADHDALVAKATAEEKMAAVRIAEERLDRHSIRTTVKGMVTEINIEPGEWVEAGKPIVRVISLDPIRVECFVDGRKYDHSLVGKTASFSPAGAESEPQEWTGKVTFVSPEMHPVTSQVRVMATIENPDAKLRAGMRGKLVIQP